MTVVLAALLAAAAVIAGVIAGGRLAAVAFLISARHVTGLDLNARSVSQSGSVYLLDDMTASTRDGAVFVAAPRVRIALGPAGVDVALERPRFVVSPLRLHSDDGEALRSRYGATHLTVRDGTLLLTRGEVPEPAVTFDGIDGDARLAPSANSTQYDAILQLADGSARYPIVAHARGGKAVWTAPSLPLAPFATLQDPDASLLAVGGLLRDVDIDVTQNVRASARLERASMLFAGHTLHDCTGS